MKTFKILLSVMVLSAQALWCATDDGVVSWRPVCGASKYFSAVMDNNMDTLLLYVYFENKIAAINGHFKLFEGASNVRDVRKKLFQQAQWFVQGKNFFQKDNLGASMCSEAQRKFYEQSLLQVTMQHAVLLRQLDEDLDVVVHAVLHKKYCTTSLVSKHLLSEHEIDLLHEKKRVKALRAKVTSLKNVQHKKLRSKLKKKRTSLCACLG
ncbi:MAG: hypothetical protein OXC30_05345 [Alphaproteobacteria bacterium]|nr:hypothetical protein [Alphaproteobacteria bacterium]